MCGRPGFCLGTIYVLVDVTSLPSFPSCFPEIHHDLPCFLTKAYEPYLPIPQAKRCKISCPPTSQPAFKWDLYLAQQDLPHPETSARLMSSNNPDLSLNRVGPNGPFTPGFTPAPNAGKAAPKQGYLPPGYQRGSSSTPCATCGGLNWRYSHQNACKVQM